MRLMILAVLAIALGGTACSRLETAGSQTPSPATATATPPPPPVTEVTTPDAATDVEVRHGEFAPVTVRIKAGQTVTWRWNGPIQHDVVSFDGLFDSGIKSGGASYTLRFDQPGRYCYQCLLHPGANLCGSAALPGVYVSSRPTTPAGGGAMSGMIVVEP